MRDKLATILMAPTKTTREILELMERMDIWAWSLIPGAIRYDKDKVQTSPTDRMADVMSDIDEAQRKLTELETRRMREQIEIREMCDKCEDLIEQEKYVIVKRYMYMYKWDYIADILDLSDRRIFQLHGSALEKLETFLGAEVDKM